MADLGLQTSYIPSVSRGPTAIDPIRQRKDSEDRSLINHNNTGDGIDTMYSMATEWGGDGDSSDDWNTVMQNMSEYDEKLVSEWKDELNGLLTFSGLFSAVVTAFVAVSYTWLSGATPTSAVPVTISPDLAASLNSLWVCSLAMSLVAALFAIVIPTWLREYPVHASLRNTAPHQMVRLRELRRRSLHTWQVPGIISAVPVILQLSLILFLIGLCLLFSRLDRKVFIPLATFCALSTVVLVFTILAPLFSASCAYKSTTALVVRMAWEFICLHVTMLWDFCRTWWQRLFGVATKEKQKTKLQADLLRKLVACMQQRRKDSLWHGFQVFGQDYWAIREKTCLMSREVQDECDHHSLWWILSRPSFLQRRLSYCYLDIIDAMKILSGSPTDISKPSDTRTAVLVLHAVQRGCFDSMFLGFYINRLVDLSSGLEWPQYPILSVDGLKHVQLVAASLYECVKRFQEISCMELYQADTTSKLPNSTQTKTFDCSAWLFKYQDKTVTLLKLSAWLCDQYVQAPARSPVMVQDTPWEVKLDIIVCFAAAALISATLGQKAAQRAECGASEDSEASRNTGEVVGRLTEARKNLLTSLENFISSCNPEIDNRICTFELLAVVSEQLQIGEDGVPLCTGRALQSMEESLQTLLQHQQKYQALEPEEIGMLRTLTNSLNTINNCSASRR